MGRENNQNLNGGIHAAEKAKRLIKKGIKDALPYGIIVLFRKLRELNEKKLKLKTDIKFVPKTLTHDGKFIVTLTSYGKRLKTTAPYAIASLMNQTVQPDKIVLWLEYGLKLPSEIKYLVKEGLEVRYCDDIKSYKKLIPALREFPDHVLVTADDDIHYPSNWFELLYQSYQKDKAKIYCHRAHEICLDENKKIIPYNEWRSEVRTIEYKKRIFPTTGGGILYPPRTLHENCVNEKEFLALCPTGDDIWFWAMARLKGTEYEIVKGAINAVQDIGNCSDGLWLINCAGKNDEQIKNIIEKYPEIMSKII